MLSTSPTLFSLWCISLSLSFAINVYNFHFSYRVPHRKMQMHQEKKEKKRERRTHNTVNIQPIKDIIEAI